MSEYSRIDPTADFQMLSRRILFSSFNWQQRLGSTRDTHLQEHAE